MPNNPITVPLPQDLPTNWTYGQTIGAAGTDVGLTQQHGYNYLMQQVNAAQQAAKEVGAAFSGLTAASLGAAPATEDPNNPGCYYRMNNGVQEWINPPGITGVEYRTTERWQGKPVYQKLVNFGYAPNSSSSSVSHGIENFSQCAGLHGTLGGANLIGHSNVVAVDVNASAITIQTNSDLSGSNVLVLVKYSKTTD